MDGSLFATGSMDHFVRVWSMPSDLTDVLIGSLAVSKAKHAGGMATTAKSRAHSIGFELFQFLSWFFLDFFSHIGSALRITTPVASTNDVHKNYVDCVRFYAELLISKVGKVFSKFNFYFFSRASRKSAYGLSPTTLNRWTRTHFNWNGCVPPTSRCLQMSYSWLDSISPTAARGFHASLSRTLVRLVFSIDL